MEIISIIIDYIFKVYTGSLLGFIIVLSFSIALGIDVTLLYLKIICWYRGRNIMHEVLCPKCAEKGIQTWVLQNNNCSVCGHQDGH